MAGIPPLEPFTVTGAPPTQAARWKVWVERLETYFEALDVQPERRMPLLLHIGGADIHKIFKSVTEVRPRTYETLKGAITAHFEPYANPDYERFLLCQARQVTDESVDVFYARLKELASTCTLPDEEEEIRAQFIQRCSSSKLRERVLQQPNMQMKDILTLGRSQELSRARAAHMEQTPAAQTKAEAAYAVTTDMSQQKDTYKGRPKNRSCKWCTVSLQAMKSRKITEKLYEEKQEHVPATKGTCSL
ncbi:hypothetical protein NDU88_001743 [Pleurodeles waltl]|uniref:Retrotransposon gag domain-containing protein n=1 Tax=Pleurodeles waltl TaxID=8319 RepID=A0AAV7W0W0_PLEWA|nr:hypothetical protein NDU88_001743 [Pleurodeles waltl]